MRKKLNLVLREPVKLHEMKVEPPKLPARFDEEIVGKREVEQPKTDKISKLAAVETGNVQKSETQIERKQIAPKAENQDDLTEILKNMSPRVRQIWEYFCEAAKKDGDLQNSFVVTRSEVMRQAGIGSTNTYRDAIKKFQTDGLIEIELRPGVNSGSIFYLTNKGIELAKV